jgi:hypothetical protein
MANYLDVFKGVKARGETDGKLRDMASDDARLVQALVPQELKTNKIKRKRKKKKEKKEKN